MASFPAGGAAHIEDRFTGAGAQGVGDEARGKAVQRDEVRQDAVQRWQTVDPAEQPQSLACEVKDSVERRIAWLSSSIDAHDVVAMPGYKFVPVQPSASRPNVSFARSSVARESESSTRERI